MSNGPLDTAPRIGSMLLAADDVPTAAAAVEAFLLDPGDEAAATLRRLGLDANLARDLRPVLPIKANAVREACALGAAWALGRRSVVTPPTWEPVVTSGDLTEEGIDRATAETLIGLVVGAKRTVRLFSAFVDRAGLDVLGVSLGAAIGRGVRVVVGYPLAGDKTRAVEPFANRLRGLGDGARLRIVPIGPERPFPHVKLLAVDGDRAYLGSANLTWPALTSNVEFGALVRGTHVATLERCFDELVDPQAQPEEEQWQPSTTSATGSSKP